VNFTSLGQVGHAFELAGAPFGVCFSKGDDMRQAPPCLGTCMLVRIVLEPFGMEAGGADVNC
jgi:hypothetical protein